MTTQSRRGGLHALFAALGLLCLGSDCQGPTSGQVLDFHLVPNTTDYGEQWLLDQPIGQYSQNLELKPRSSLTVGLIRGPRDGEMVGSQPVTATVFLEEVNGRGLQSFMVNAEPREILVPSGTYRLTAHPSTAQEAAFLEPYRDGEFEVPEVGGIETLEFLTGSPIRGRVRIDDADESALGGLKVSAVPVFEDGTRGLSGQWTYTQSFDGGFVLELPPGQYEVRIAPTESSAVVPQATIGPFRLPEDRHEWYPEAFTFVYPDLETYALSGDVFDGRTEAGASNVKVCVDGYIEPTIAPRPGFFPGGPFTDCTITDANGSYEFSLPEAEYTVRFQPAAASGLAPLERTQNIEGNSALSPTLQITPQIAGQVFDTLCTPIEGIEVQLQSKAPPSYSLSTQTDEDGRWRLDAPAGLYRLAMVPPTGLLAGLARYEDIAVPTLTPLRFALEGGRVIDGRVQADDVGGTVESLSNVWIQAQVPGQPEPISQAVSGPGGLYRLMVPSRTREEPPSCEELDPTE